ncbi:peptide chain release factor N(5)-glutamine methyltransferase [Sphingobium amiense]|uniref:Release factor glutamine methyltransferase n=1 Tax=Sphingobium amiense TaxID=135719 RepID=A0A494WF58_9SPHN|nr:peptide chain release factor N(5)-glutamine methyltransferase [Sphingobium amiense]BBD99435.1 peptide chain release factor N(5)-glutamine methyltransferase [Sphingobium amiense]
MSVADAIRAATVHIAVASDTPRLDAELLMAHALGLSRTDMLLRQRDLDVPAAFTALVERRCAGEPVAHIVGTRDFWTITLAVTPDVLIPRPDSETLIEAAVAHFGGRGPATVLDLGTGSGALLLAALAEWPQATGIGVDASPAALAVAQENAARLGLASRAAFRLGDWAAGVEGPFDLILVNPPYIGTDEPLSGDVLRDPPSALFAGRDGLDDYRRIVPDLQRLIAPGGFAAIEIGHRQTSDVSALLAGQGLKVAVRQDLGQRDRCLAVTRPG